MDRSSSDYPVVFIDTRLYEKEVQYQQQYPICLYCQPCLVVNRSIHSPRIKSIFIQETPDAHMRDRPGLRERWTRGRDLWSQHTPLSEYAGRARDIKPVPNLSKLIVRRHSTSARVVLILKSVLSRRSGQMKLFTAPIFLLNQVLYYKLGKENARFIHVKQLLLAISESCQPLF